MPHFHYKAISRDGVTEEGEMIEVSAEAVIRRIQESGNIPVLAEKISSGRTRQKTPAWPAARRKYRRPDIAAFTRSLSSLLGSGTPLDRALDIMLEVESESAMRTLIEDIQGLVRGGAPLSGAMEQQGDTFSGFYLSMIRAAEASGTLSEGLEQLLEYLERNRELREKTVSALIYPAILLTVAGLSVLILLVLVVPQFRPIFEEMGTALPVATRLVLAVSDFFAAYWWLALVTIAAATAATARALSVPANRHRVDALSLRMTLFGPLISAQQTARFSRSLGTLLANGVPVLQSIDIAKDTLTNRAMVSAVRDAAKSLKEGGELSCTLHEADVFPALAIQMVKVGEEGGNLDRMMLRVSRIYDGEVAIAVQRLLAMLEPVLIIGLGIMIAGIIMSILVGVISINDLPV